MSDSPSFTARYVTGRPDWRRHRARVVALREARYDLDQRHDHTEAAGWNLDQHDVDLIPEPPRDALEPVSADASDLP